MNQNNQIESDSPGLNKRSAAPLEPGWNDFPDWLGVRAIVSDDQLEQLERHREGMALVLGIQPEHLEITTTLYV